MQIDAGSLIADIAGKTARLELRQDQTEAALEDLQEGATELSAQVRSLHALVADLAPAEDEEEESSGKLDPCQVPNWRTLDGEQTAKQWGVLIDWSRKVLYPTYARQHWRPCWYLHWSVVEELSALCAVWHWSYRKDAPPTRAAEWHARWWPHTRGVLDATFKRCGPEKPGATLRHALPKGIDANLFADDEALSSFIANHVRSREAEMARDATD
ncbi:hypothetical protein [Streptomyces sp. G-5]|uniref:hypothetical protein n=1 Tax=Streptomyces sp. G-5 TaxID=2977231 RepID=UPI0021D2F275|nr:hypothetical protein [Streptomyces sp. G-5]MCU4750285.1 hypothetical protein [Streptomyces sp. G-5]